MHRPHYNLWFKDGGEQCILVCIDHVSVTTIAFLALHQSKNSIRDSHTPRPREIVNNIMRHRSDTVKRSGDIYCRQCDMMFDTYTLKPMSLPSINSLDLTVSEIYSPDKLVKVTTTRSKVKSRSHHDVAYLQAFTNVPTKYQHLSPQAF